MEMPYIKKRKCLRCGAVWLPRAKDPVECPRCKSTFWNKPKKNKKRGGK